MVDDNVKRWTAIVPTLGRSPWLEECLQAIREDGGSEVRIILVDQSDEPVNAPLADKILRLTENQGFAIANNLALAEVETPYVATINDDAVIQPGWSRALLEVLDQRPEVAAMQGIQLAMEGEASGDRKVDGAGLAWNRFAQAVQIGHGELFSAWYPKLPASETVSLFGVSATAACFRVAALRQVALADGSLFDPRFVSYYEDVDLACRLHSAGYEALLMPSAIALHAGSATGRQLPFASQHLIYRNRYLTLARFLGRRFWLWLPRLLLRDLFDLWHAWRRDDPARRRAIPRALWRTLIALPGYLHSGPSGDLSPRASGLENPELNDSRSNSLG